MFLVVVQYRSGCESAFGVTDNIEDAFAEAAQLMQKFALQDVLGVAVRHYLPTQVRTEEQMVDELQRCVAPPVDANGELVC